MSKRNVPSFEYAPTTGVRIDFKRFMNQFLTKNTVRYEHFSEVWRERNMSYLYAGRCTDREIREFVERVMLIAQEYFLPPFQFQVRVGGLYLLYSIYQSQPLLPRVKIRMTPTQWQDTMYFQQQAAQQNHLDVVYVFQRLLQDQAFLFCYTPSEMSIHSSLKDVEEREDDLADSLKEEKSTVTSLFNYESLEKLSYLQDQYQQMKISLAGQNATKPDKSLDVVQGELVEDIIVLLQSFKEKVTTFSKNRQKSSEGTSQEEGDVPETTGGRRQVLKSQAFSQLKAQPNKRHKLVVVNNSSPSPVKGTATTTSVAEGVSTTVRTEITPPATKSTQDVTKNTQDVTKNTPYVTKNTQKSVSKLPVIDISDSSGTSDSDVDYIPPKSSSAKKNKSQRVARLEDKISPLKKRPIVKDLKQVMKPVTASSMNIQDGKSDESMPLLADDDTAVETHIPSSNHISNERIFPGNADCGSGNRVAEIVVRKRGRPRLYNTSPQKINITEILVTPKHHIQLGSSKENPSHLHKVPSSKNISDDISSASQSDHNDMSLTNKIAFKWKRPGKRTVDQTATSSPKEGMTLEKIVTDTFVQPRKRGRPRKHCDSAMEISPTEVIVYPKIPAQSSTQVKPSTGKYEMVYFPAGMAQAADVITMQKIFSHQELGNLSETVKQMYSNARQINQNTETKQVTPTKEKSARRVRKHANLEPASGTVTEIIVRKEIGRPTVMLSQTKGEHSKEKHQEKTSGETPKNHSYGSSSASVNSSNENRTCVTELNNLSDSVKVEKNKSLPNDPIQRLKERCKRKRKAEEKETNQFVKKCSVIETERSHVTVLSSDEEELASDYNKQKQEQNKSTVIIRSVGTTQFNMTNKQSKAQLAVSSKFMQEYQVDTEKRPIICGTKTIKTTSDSNLLPWTTICSKLSSEPTTTPAESEVKPKTNVKTKLDPSSVQFRFL